MKTVSKQWQPFGSNRTAASPLRGRVAKNLSVHEGRLRNRIKYVASLQSKSARIARCASAVKKRKLKNAGRAINEQLQKSLRDAGAISSAQQNTLLGTGGFSGIVPLDHPLVMVYISSCQQNNRMIYVSPQIANVGFTQEMWLGETDLRLLQVHAEDRERLTQALQNSCLTGEKFNCHYRLHDSNGKIRWFHDEATVIQNDSGTPLFIRGVMLDITDKKEMEAELDGHRYYLERHVESRAEQLTRRIALLESCNASLCDKLALAKQELVTLKQQETATSIRTETQDNDRAEQIDVISNLARNMIKWRVAAAGAVA